MAHKFLYWFTHTELRPVSPYPKVESTKHSTNYLQTQQFLNTTRTTQSMLKKPYFSTPCTPRNPIKEWLTLTPLQTRIKERLHLKRRCKNSKPVVQFARTSTFTKIKGFLEQAHLKIPLENLSKIFSILLLTLKVFDLCQKRNCSACFHVREAFLYIENSFKLLFKKQLKSCYENNRLSFKLNRFILWKLPTQLTEITVWVVPLVP